ncbi:MAG: hypothetical protein U5R49_12740 [Deltaproteobacteria bacterium]|nr:hypothetical protein [Deltaproteobacteria bacterium]
MDIRSLIKQRVPEDWTESPITVTCYQVYAVMDSFNIGKTWKLLDIICLFAKGSYMFPMTFKTMTQEKQLGFSSRTEFQQSPKSLWMFIVRSGAEHQGDPDIEKRIRGFFYIIAGRNIAYEKFFTFTINPDDTQSFYSDSFLNPNAFPMIDMAKIERKLDLISPLLTEKAELEPEIEIGLSWYAEALESSGIDAFLKIWVAFEALSMSDTNVRSSYELISQIYDLDINLVGETLLLGRIHGYRSAILHGKNRGKFSIEILKYFEYLVGDIVIFKIFEQKSQTALEYMKRNNRNIVNVLLETP